MMSIDPIRPYLDFIKIAAVIGVLVAVYGVGYAMGGNKWQGKFDTEAAEHVATKASHKGLIDNLAALTKAAAEKAKAASAAAKADRKTNDARFKDAKNEAAKARAALSRALRAGTVQLRPEFTCSAAGSAQSGAAAAAGGQDEGAELRRTREGSILDAIDDGDAADNWIGWLQSELTSTRKACSLE